MIVFISILTFFLILYIVIKKLFYYDNPRLFSFFIIRYSIRDRKNFPKSNSIVFTGSSVVQFWKSLKNDLHPINVLNRGIAGTKINEIAYWANRLVIKYRPKAVVLYAGSNDIQGNKPRTPQQVFDGFKTFVNKIHFEIPGLPIYFISITPSPAKTRWKNRTLIKEANSLIAEFCGTNDNLNFIDTTDAFLDTEGSPVLKYFKKDMIHFNEKGYAVWTSIFKPILDKLDTNN